MPKHRALKCTSDSSSSDYGVPDTCGFGQCRGPFQDVVNIYSVSSIGCDTSSCPNDSDGAFSDLCETDTLSKCPKIEHAVKVEGSSSSSSSSSSSGSDSRGRCDRCKYKRCRCHLGQCNYRAILCESESGSDCDSDDCTDRAFIAPIPGCNIGMMPGWSDCTTDDSDDECERCRKPRDQCGCYNCPDCGRRRKHCTCKGGKDRKEVKVKVDVTICKVCLYPANKCKCGDKRPIKPKGRSFEVTFVAKTGHCWERRICCHRNGKFDSKPHCVAIDSVKGKDIHLTRGHVYEFKITPVNGVVYSFYFTTDPLGGPTGHACDSSNYRASKLAGCPEPCSSGAVILTASADLPKQFYYQCVEVPCMGGFVYIHDK